ncbi:MAG: hypothetical protein ACM3US_15265 [Sphingomonadaceae bacterium]
MELALQPEEARLLRDILSEYLSDLRMEIANTEQYEWREEMKKREAAIQEIIVRIERLGTARV